MSPQFFIVYEISPPASLKTTFKYGADVFLGQVSGRHLESHGPNVRVVLMGFLSENKAK